MYRNDNNIPTKRFQFKNTGTLAETPVSKVFLKGPIPLDWLTAASKLPGKAINVGIALWWLRGMSQGKPFKLTERALKALNVSNDATYDALDRLEGAGLVQLQRNNGQRPVITILEC